MHDGVITGYRHGVGGHVVDLRWGRYNWWIKTRRGRQLHRRHWGTNERQLIDSHNSSIVWKANHTEKRRNEGPHGVNIVATKEKTKVSNTLGNQDVYIDGFSSQSNRELWEKS